MKYASQVLLASCLIASVGVQAADLTIQLNDVKPLGGKVMVAIYNSAEQFLKKPFRGQVVTADEKVILIKDLPAGDYALAVFHDVNENGKMDINTSGIPLEGYAFGNNAEGKMGPPSFDAAKISLPEAGLSTQVSLK
ncbi:MAG: DUF2141 domain-containing protein [Proteobacteria bacterium]|nr:DUF2141 domain-containing protein [Pseudomonadota bacterium]